MKRSLKTKMAKLQKMFPDMWMKDGAEFDASHKDSIWTGGEDNFIREHGLEMCTFDYNHYHNTDGEHPTIRKALDSLGLYAAFYDAGTVFIYEN